MKCNIIFTVKEFLIVKDYSMYPKLNTDEKIIAVLNSVDEINERIFKFPTSHVKIDEKKLLL